MICSPQNKPLFCNQSQNYQQLVAPISFFYSAILAPILPTRVSVMNNEKQHPGVFKVKGDTIKVAALLFKLNTMLPPPS